VADITFCSSDRTALARALLGEDLARRRQGREFGGGRRLEEAVEPRRDAEAPRRRVVHLLQLGEDVADGVAHALGGAAPDIQPLGHLVQRQALGGGRQQAGQFQQLARLLVPHLKPTPERYDRF
jgi:hypothetical protein